MERVREKITTPRWIINESICRYEFASQFARNKLVIDAACGTGYGAIIILKQEPKKISCFDIDRKTIYQVGRKLQGTDGRVSFEWADITDLPCLNHSYDLFISLETIEHIKDTKKYLSEVKRVLKKEGVFICSTPNRKVTNPGAEFMQQPFNSYHLFEFSREEFTALLGEQFGQIDLFGQNFISKERMNRWQNLASWLSPRLAARLRQICKLPQVFTSNKVKHKVKKTMAGFEPEYLIAVCSRIK